MQAPKEMVLSSSQRSVISFGVVTEERQKSTNKRLTSRKYMGECRWWSMMIRSTTKKSPTTVMRYSTENGIERKT